MEPPELTRETLVRRHQLRGSVLPILSMAYNRKRQHLLTADEQALRLFSTRKELAVLWLDPQSPSPIDLLWHSHRDVYVVAYDDEPAKHADASTVQVLHASLAPLLRWRPHDGFLATMVLHSKSSLIVTSGPSELRLWKLDEDEARPVAVLNEHSARGAMHVLHASSSDILIGAVEGTAWAWRLNPPEGPVGPRLALGWEAHGRSLNESDPPSISCLKHLGGGRVVVGLDDGVVVVWFVPSLNSERGPPQVLAQIDAHTSQGVAPTVLKDGASDAEQLPDARLGVFELSGLEDQLSGRLEFFSCGGQARSVKHWLVGGSRTQSECNRLHEEHHPSCALLTSKRTFQEPDGVEDDAYAAWLQATCRATPMRLTLLELGVGDEAVARRTLLAACSGGLVTLYEIHAPAWHAALCADRILDLQRGLLLDEAEHCVVALTDGGHIEALHAEGHCLRIPPPAPEILAKANKALALTKAKDKRPPGKRLHTGRAALVGLGRSASQGDRVAIGWLPTSSSIVVGRSDGVLEVVTPDWARSLCERDVIDSSTAAVGSSHLARIDGKQTITCVCPLPAKGLAVVGDADGGLKLWALSQKKCVWSADAHTGSVCALAAGVLADARGFPMKHRPWEDPQTPRRQFATNVLVASASGDGVVRLWRATSSSLVIAGYFVAQGSVTALCVAQASLEEAQTFVGFDSGLIEAWPIDAAQLKGEEEPKDLDRGARGGHLQEVTTLDALPSSALVLSASLDRSLALWRARPASTTLELLRCIVLGHAIFAAVLVRSRGGLDAVVADGTRVCRVCLTDDAPEEEASVLRERSVATPGRSMLIDAGVSLGDNDTVLTSERRAAARLTLDVPRLYADEATATGSFLGGQKSPPPQRSQAEDAPWLAKSGAHQLSAPWQSQRAKARPRSVAEAVRPESGAGAYLFPERTHQEEPVLEEDLSDEPAPLAPVARTDLPAPRDLEKDEALAAAFKTRDFGRGFVHGAALPAILRNWWPQDSEAQKRVFGEAVDAAAEETSVFAVADREALEWLGAEEEDEEYDAENLEKFRRKRADKLLKLKHNRRRGAPVSYECLCDIASHLCHKLNDCPTSHAPCLERGGGGWVKPAVKRRTKPKKYRDMARTKRRKVYADWGECCDIETTQLGDSVAPDAPLPTPVGDLFRPSVRLPPPAAPEAIVRPARRPPAEVPEVFAGLFTDPRLAYARAYTATGHNPGRSEPLEESASIKPMRPCVALREARKVFEAHAEELAAARIARRPPQTLAASCYAVYCTAWGPRHIAEAHLVALLDGLFGCGTLAPALTALSQFFGVEGPWPQLPSCTSYVHALTWLRDRASLFGNVAHDLRENDGLCYLSASRRACATCARVLAPSPVIASSIVQELADLAGLGPSPHGHWDEPVDAEAFALILVTKISAGEAIAKRCAETLFAMDRSDRIMASRHGKREEVDELQWYRGGPKALQDLFLRFVTKDSARCGCVTGDAFRDCMRGGLTSGWPAFNKPTLVNPVDDSLLSADELSLKRVVTAYSDPLDQQVCYLDFWAMLWVYATLHKRLPPLHELYFIASEQMVGIDDDVGQVLRTYCSYAGASSVVEKTVHKSHLATLFPGQLRMTELVNLKRRPPLHPGTLTIAREPLVQAAEALVGDTELASSKAALHLERKAKPVLHKRKNQGVTLRAEGVPLYASDVSDMASCDLARPAYETMRPIPALSRSMKAVRAQPAAVPQVLPGQHRTQATFTYMGDPFYKARVLKQEPASLEKQYASAQEWQAKLLERGEHPPYSITDEMLRVESTSGIYNALGKGVSPVRFLPPDEVQKLKDELEMKRAAALTSKRAKQRNAGQTEPKGHLAAVTGYTPPVSRRGQRGDNDAERLLAEQMRLRREALAAEAERLRLEEEARRRAPEAARLAEAQKLERLRLLAAEEAERARQAAALEAQRLKLEEEARRKREEEERLERERIEAERRALALERARLEAERKRKEEEARALAKLKRERARAEAMERETMHDEERLSHELRDLVREEARQKAEAERLRQEAEMRAKLEKAERASMKDNEKEGLFLRKFVEEERRKEAERLAEIARLEAEKFLKEERAREAAELTKMAAEEEYERMHMAEEAERERLRLLAEAELRARLDAEGRMREENERAASELAKLKTRNVHGLFNVVKQAKTGLNVDAFKGKLLGKVAAKGEAARLAAEAKALAERMAATDEEERRRLEAERLRLEAEEAARKQAEEDAKPKEQPVFGCSFAFSEDLRFDPFDEANRPKPKPANVPNPLDANFDDVALEENTLPETVQRIFRESRGEKVEYDQEAFHVPDVSVVEASVAIPHRNEWSHYFDRKHREVFEDKDKVDKALLVGNQSKTERGRALQKVLAQSARLYASLGPEKAGELLNGTTVQDASRKFHEVMGDAPNVDFTQQIDLGDANLMVVDESTPLTYFRVAHGSVLCKKSTTYNLTLDHNGAVATIMLVCIKGDADLLVARGRIPTLQDSDWRDTSLRQEKRVCMQPDHVRYGLGKYGIAVMNASKEPCHFAIYGACTGLMDPGESSATLKRVEPLTRRLKVLAELPPVDLVGNFAAALEDATNRVANELALEKALKEGKKASEVEEDMVRENVATKNKNFKEEARRVAQSTGKAAVAAETEVERALKFLKERDAAAAKGLAKDTDAARLDAQQAMEAWNVPLSEMDNPDNAEDAVAFEKLMYRMGLAHMKVEDPVAMAPLDTDPAYLSLAPVVTKKKKKGRRRRRARSPDRGETVEELDARWTIARGSDAWKREVKATVGPRIDYVTKAPAPKPLRYHLLIGDKRYDHQPPPKSPGGTRPSIPYNLRVTSSRP